MRGWAILFLFLACGIAQAQMPTSLGEAMAGTGAAAAIATVPGSTQKPNVKEMLQKAADSGNAVDPNNPKAAASTPAEYIYDPTGLRDPFFPEGLPQMLDNQNAKSDNQKGITSTSGEAAIDMSADPIIRYALETYKAIAIVWNTGTPKAMVQAMNGSFYTVRIGTKIGKLGGKVAAIREREIVVAEPVIEGGKESYLYRKIELR